jgi:hypothetical protein
LRYQSPLYKLSDIIIDVENPYNENGEFKVTIIESNNKNGIIRNPFNETQPKVSPSGKSIVIVNKKKSNYFLN